MKKVIILASLVIVTSSVFAQFDKANYKALGSDTFMALPIVGFTIDETSEEIKEGEYIGWNISSFIFHHHISDKGVIEIYSIAEVITKNDSIKIHFTSITGDSSKVLDLEKEYVLNYSFINDVLILRSKSNIQYKYVKDVE